MKILTSIIVISFIILLSVFAGACDSGPGQTTDTESTTTTNQPVINVFADPATYYANIAELSLDADLIAYGKIDRVIEIKEQIVGHNPKGNNIHYFTDFSFSINRLLKGDMIEEAVIHQMGAAGKMVVHEDPLFKTGEEYVLFLHKTESGVYYVLGGPQGRFMVDNGKIYSMDNIDGDNSLISPGLSYNGVDLEDFIGDISETLQ